MRHAFCLLALRFSAGKRDEALKILEAAATAESSMPFEFGPPAIPKPAAELFADQLLAAGRSAEAAAAYQRVFERAPGRTAARDGLSAASVHVH